MLFALIVPRFTPALLFLLIIAPGLLGKLRPAHNGKPGDDPGESDGIALLWGCLIMVISIGVTGSVLYALFPQYFQFGQIMPQRPAAVAVGAAIAVAGMALTCWARYVIGANWVGGPFLRERHELVTRGPYHLVRHPMYVGFAVFHIGILMATGNIVPIIGDGIFRLLLLRQSLSEERLLAERFGDDYTAYIRSTGRFLPRLRRK